MNNDNHFLMEALKLAQLRRGYCAPNPSVGAVIVKNNQIISSGYHVAAGQPHAEIIALQSARQDLQDATLYVTLEPCCHWGKTPPCTKAIIESGIKKVIYSYKDPNLQVSGKGQQELVDAGVECRSFPLQAMQDFYRSYQYWQQNKIPWVTSKLAISLDAKIAAPDGKPISITGLEAQQLTHEWRNRSDAIFTSIRTIINDDPALNVRLENQVIAKPLYVVDSNLQLPLKAKILTTAKSITVFHQEGISEAKLMTLNERGITCHAVSKDHNYLNLQEMLIRIGEDGVHDLWVEAGGKLFNTFIEKGLVHKSLIYIAPKLLGSAAYPAFTGQKNIFAENAQINWYYRGDDCICELNWGE